VKHTGNPHKNAEDDIDQKVFCGSHLEIGRKRGQDYGKYHKNKFVHEILLGKVEYRIAFVDDKSK